MEQSMVSLYSQILEMIVFPNRQIGTIFIPRSTPLGLEESKEFGTFFIPNNLFPEQYKVIELSNGEDFVRDFEEVLTKQSFDRIFLFPPFISNRFLSDDLRSMYRQMNLDEIALYLAVNNLQTKNQVGILAPINILTDIRGQTNRKQIGQIAQLQYVITHDFSPQYLGFRELHSQFKFVTLLFEVGQSKLPVTRFFKIPLVEDSKEDKEILRDLKHLTKIEGGTTEYGYVLRGGLSNNSSWLHDANHPLIQKRVKDMMHFGSVQNLSELVHIKSGINIVREALDLQDGNNDGNNGGIPIIDGKNILSGNILNFEETKFSIKEARPETLLRSGDICLRKVINLTGSLFVVRIEEFMLPLVASNSVVILRPISKETNTRFLLRYLQSETALHYLRSQGSSVFLSPHILAELPVPVMDGPLTDAWNSLHEAEKAFDIWQHEVQNAFNTLFSFQSSKDARLHLLSTGRLVRQRQQAAELANSLEYRIRTLYPHPIAYRWRTVQASKPDLVGLINILWCAEVTICYLACIAIVSCRATKEISIKSLDGLADKLTKKKHGIGIGDWVDILREIKGSKAIKHSANPIPFFETTRFLDDEGVNKAVQLLSDNRNKQFHRKGAQGVEIPVRFEECFNALKRLFESIEFLTEYDLRYIEETQRDSLNKMTKYSYRRLIGDHPLSPIEYDTTSEPELEARSLYLADTSGQLYLLRPLLTQWECPKCGQWEIFHLDSYDKVTDTCKLNSLEHDHVFESKNLSEAFRHVGLLL